MDFIMEMLISLIFEGALEITTAKKVPMFIRVLAAVGLLTVYIGLGGILIYLGIINRSGIVIGCGALLFVAVAIVTARKYREVKRRRK